MSRAAWISIAASASGNEIAWFSINAFPNV
jgi:hypothetical protein